MKLYVSDVEISSLFGQAPGESLVTASLAIDGQDENKMYGATVTGKFSKKDPELHISYGFSESLWSTKPEMPLANGQKSQGTRQTGMTYEETQKTKYAKDYARIRSILELVYDSMHEEREYRDAQ